MVYEGYIKTIDLSDQCLLLLPQISVFSLPFFFFSLRSVSSLPWLLLLLPQISVFSPLSMSSRRLIPTFSPPPPPMVKPGPTPLFPFSPERPAGHEGVNSHSSPSYLCFMVGGFIVTLFLLIVCSLLCYQRRRIKATERHQNELTDRMHQMESLRVDNDTQRPPEEEMPRGETRERQSRRVNEEEIQEQEMETRERQSRRVDEEEMRRRETQEQEMEARERQSRRVDREIQEQEMETRERQSLK